MHVQQREFKQMHYNFKDFLNISFFQFNTDDIHFISSLSLSFFQMKYLTTNILLIIRMFDGLSKKIPFHGHFKCTFVPGCTWRVLK